MEHKFQFEIGRRYRLEILPAGARSRTVTREMNYLGLANYDPEYLLFDARPEAGTQSVHPDQIKDSVEIDPAVWERS